MAVRSATGKTAVACGATEAKSVEVAVEAVVCVDALVEIAAMLHYVPQRSRLSAIVFNRIAVEEAQLFVIDVQVEAVSIGNLPLKAWLISVMTT